jgi:hypothetical protein
MKMKHPEMPINNVYEVSAVLASLLREDWIYTNDIASHISLHRAENYKNFSEMFRQHFKDQYSCAKNGTIVTSSKGKALNLLKVIDMLKSKDAN